MSNSMNFKFNIKDKVKVIANEEELREWYIPDELRGKTGTVVDRWLASDLGCYCYTVEIKEKYPDGGYYPPFSYKENMLELVAEPKEDKELKKPDKFRYLCDTISDLYARKNADYGDSFGISIKKYGPIAGLTRISDKFNRLENLIVHGEQNVTDESVTDTLMDLASYSLMLVMELNDLK